MRPFLLLLLVIASCSAAPVLPLAEPPIPPITQQAAAEIPGQVRIALERAGPREKALASSPASDSNDIAEVRRLHLLVVRALDDLDHDGGRHITPAKLKRARDAMRELQNRLDDFAKAHKGS